MVLRQHIGDAEAIAAALKALNVEGDENRVVHLEDGRLRLYDMDFMMGEFVWDEDELWSFMPVHGLNLDPGGGSLDNASGLKS